MAAVIPAAREVIIATLGVTTAEIRDESGSGWEYTKDPYTYKILGVPIYSECEYKLGCLPWFKLRVSPAGLTGSWPLWYGDEDLGIGGI
ncbi:MAG: hypothetical protein GWO20_10660 [Candidatus Korarchaeota archaeon]|nr:hypothetical protein [Candidatus Korarchaeota archaeon]NIU83944.1 hypothetical protein [Candidatus Thorarchaeota archaeon]NIW14072.1 hypothetical protein [Candidatus Thorarchaeota archaeon]NIW52182.1 hypothetical protein [Candidatus Korarchaeota archaeon]